MNRLGQRGNARLFRLLVSLFLATVTACATSEPIDDPSCQGAKCDELDDGPTDEEFCDARRADVLNPNRHSYTANALRWSCNDVDSISGEWRGQEYCEYFALVRLPTRDTTEILGHANGPHPKYGITETDIGLTASEVDVLDAYADEVVGQCVFTAWFTPADWEKDVPSSARAAALSPNSPVVRPPEASAALPEVMGIPVTENLFRMKFAVNTLKAGFDLFEHCMTESPAVGDFDDITDPLHDDFLRACDLNARVNDTAWRKSDNVACSAAMRMAECGCTLPDDASIPGALVPEGLRGLPLGGWSDISELPPGCEYVETGDASQTLVACDITGADVLRGAPDIKGLCRDKYADQVVVHIPIPAEQITCGAPTDSPYGEFCSEQPWIFPAADF